MIGLGRLDRQGRSYGWRELSADQVIGRASRHQAEARNEDRCGLHHALNDGDGLSNATASAWTVNGFHLG